MRTRLVLVGARHEVVLGRLVTRKPDLALVDAIAKLQLIARRLGCRVVVREPCDDLRGLLDLVGLADLCG